MANSVISPATDTLVIGLGADMTFTVVPKDENGDPFDCTGFDTVTLCQVTGQGSNAGAANDVTNITLANETGGASGFSFDLLYANYSAAVTKYGAPLLSGYIKGTNGGGDTAILWIGQIAINMNPAIASAYL